MYNDRDAREIPNEVDPYAPIRGGLRPEHASLTADELTMIVGREPALIALHGMLASPEPRLAALALLLGKAGKRSVRLHESNVPVAAYLRVLSRLCREAAEESEAFQEIAEDAAGVSRINQRSPVPFVREAPSLGIRNPPFLAPNPAVFLEAPTSGTEMECLLGGAVALPRMLADIRSANGPKSFVYHAAWNCESDLRVPMGGGSDTLGDAIRFAAAAGAQVRFMLWAGLIDQATSKALSPTDAVFLIQLANYWSQPARNNGATALNINQIRAPGTDAYCELDSKTLFAGSHHQKILVVGTEQDVTAYIGGIEFSTDRLYERTKQGQRIPGAPLFDISLRLRGMAAYSILRAFALRWSGSAAGAGRNLPGLRGASRTPPQSAPSTAVNDKRYLDAQVSHTYGMNRPFPIKVQTAGLAIAAAIRSTKQFFYMEDQYYTGTAELAAAIRDVLKSNDGRWGVAVIAAEAAVADLPDLGFHRREFLRPLVDAFPGRFLVFERMGDDGTPTGPTAYVHSKLTIVDDITAVVGSANSTYRSWTHDSEIMVTLVDRSGPGGTDPKDWHPIRAMRAAIWQRHLAPTTSALGDPAAARSLWADVSAGKMRAHVRPYGTHTSSTRPLWMRVDPVTAKVSDLAPATSWTKVFDPRG